MIYEYDGKKPVLADDVFVAPSADVIGEVSIGAGSGIWFGSVVRGDVHYIQIGENSNIQDLCMLHVTGGKFPLVIGNYVTLGHGVIVHGCKLNDYAFLGIGSTVMDDCEIGSYALIGAGALVTPGKMIPARSVVMGSPGKIVREITTAEEEMIRSIPIKYKKLRASYTQAKGFKAL